MTLLYLLHRILSVDGAAVEEDPHLRHPPRERGKNVFIIPATPYFMREAKDGLVANAEF